MLTEVELRKRLDNMKQQREQLVTLIAKFDGAIELAESMLLPETVQESAQEVGLDSIKTKRVRAR